MGKQTVQSRAVHFMSTMHLSTILVPRLRSTEECPSSIYNPSFLSFFISFSGNLSLSLARARCLFLWLIERGGTDRRKEKRKEGIVYRDRVSRGRGRKRTKKRRIAYVRQDVGSCLPAGGWYHAVFPYKTSPPQDQPAKGVEVFRYACFSIWIGTKALGGRNFRSSGIVDRERGSRVCPAISQDEKGFS